MAAGTRPCLSQRRLLIRPRGTWWVLLLLLGPQGPLFGEPPPSTSPPTPLPLTLGGRAVLYIGVEHAKHLFSQSQQLEHAHMDASSSGVWGP